MQTESNSGGGKRASKGHRQWLLWLSGAWILPLAGAWFRTTAPAGWNLLMGSALAMLAAPLPALFYLHWFRSRARTTLAGATEEAAELKMQLETVRYRTSRLREELQAADRQARLSHQLTLLGQFTAGFMHEFNNPLAIVAGRLEVLLEERREDSSLCADLEEMLKETRYMSKIATTLLQALRRERRAEVFEPAAPQRALSEAVDSLGERAREQRIRLVREIGEAPRLDIPEHVVGEVVRGLLNNAVEAVQGREEATIWVLLEPYRAAGSAVVVRIEDNGQGVPESLRPHLFEPFSSESRGREHLGLGLFLAASLLDMYDGRIRYETRPGGGASFVLELPPARFTRGQPYHWFAGEEQG